MGIIGIDTASALQESGSRCYITCINLPVRSILLCKFVCGVLIKRVFFRSTFSPGDTPHAELSTHDALHVAYPGIPQTCR